MKNKLLLSLLPTLALSGCAYMYSTTTRGTDPRTGIITETTSARAYAFFDSNAALTKFVNRSGYVCGTNMYAPGTYVSGLNENATSTNLVSIISAVAQGVVSGLKP